MCQNLIKRASTCVHFRKSCGWNMKNKFDWYYFIIVKCVPILYISPWCGGHRLPTSDFCQRGSIPHAAKILFVSKYFYLTRCASLSMDFLLFFCRIPIVFLCIQFCVEVVFQSISFDDSANRCCLTKVYLCTYSLCRSLQYQEIDTTFSKKCKLGDYVNRPVQIRLITFIF